MRNTLRYIIISFVILFATPLWAAGFFVGEQDATANAMGLAVTARLNNASTIFYNPAGLAFLKGFQLDVGTIMVFPFFKYSDPNGNYGSTDAEFHLNVAPHLYTSYTFNNKFSVGLGFNVPYGLKVPWPDDFAGRGFSKDVDLRVMHIYAGFAWRFLKNWAVGVNFKAIPTTAMFERDFMVGTDKGNLETMAVKIGGAGWAFGGSIGVMGTLFNNLHLGFSYTSRAKLVLDGDAHFALPSDFHDYSIFHDQGGQATLYLPDVFSLGIGYDITKKVYVEFDFNYTLWSVYDTLSIKFKNDPSGQLSQDVYKGWKNTETFRLAASWKVIPSLILRAGGGYDVSPVPDSTLDPMLPDSDRYFFALGGGYDIKSIGLRVDLAYTFVKFLKRTVTAKDGNPFPATYNTTAHLLGITIGYHY